MSNYRFLPALDLFQRLRIKRGMINVGSWVLSNQSGLASMNTDLTLKDNRPITSLVIDYNQRAHVFQYFIGSNGVTKIEPYNEFAGPDYVLWFVIYVGEEIVWRVNGRYVVEIGYAH